MTTRRTAAITGEGRFTVIEQDIPELKNGEVLVKTAVSLISPGTELCGIKAIRESPDPAAGARPFGYSCAGTVLKGGKGCEDIPEGLRVACMGSGYARHATLNVIPRNLLIPIPDTMGFEPAAFAHLGATALHAVRRADLTFGEHFTVAGLGILGQLAVQIGSLCGTHVAALDLHPQRRELAVQHGAEWCGDPVDTDAVASGIGTFSRGYGLDCALIAFGGDITPALRQLVPLMKTAPDTHAMGRIVVLGWSHFSQENWPVAMGNIDLRSSSRCGAGYHDDVYEHGGDYPGVFVPWTSRRNMEEILRFAAAGKLDLKSLITHRLPLDRFAEGAEVLVSAPGEALGVIITYQG